MTELEKAIELFELFISSAYKNGLVQNLESSEALNKYWTIIKDEVTKEIKQERD